MQRVHSHTCCSLQYTDVLLTFLSLSAALERSFFLCVRKPIAIEVTAETKSQILLARCIARKRSIYVANNACLERRIGLECGAWAKRPFEDLTRLKESGESDENISVRTWHKRRCKCWKRNFTKDRSSQILYFICIHLCICDCRVSKTTVFL